LEWHQANLCPVGTVNCGTGWKAQMFVPGKFYVIVAGLRGLIKKCIESRKT